MRCFYHPDYHYPLPPEHPFPMDKFTRAYGMVAAEGRNLEIRLVEPAPWEQLHRVHARDYLNRLATGGLSRAERIRLGLPDNRALLDRSRLETAGTVAAVHAALEGGVACNLAGGTHHAFSDRGMGFCVLNDTAVAVADLRAGGFDGRILVVDTDAHQGNGTHALLADDPAVYCYSIHVGRNYPTLKVAGDVDVALPRWVDGPEYIRALAASLPPVFPVFEPELVIWVAGADCHAQDRFGQMKLTQEDLHRRDALVLDLCGEYETPVTVLYGGGYNRDRELTARIHADGVLAAERLSGASEWDG